MMQAERSEVWGYSQLYSGFCLLRSHFERPKRMCFEDMVFLQNVHEKDKNLCSLFLDCILVYDCKSPLFVFFFCFCVWGGEFTASMCAYHVCVSHECLVLLVVRRQTSEGLNPLGVAICELPLGTVGNRKNLGPLQEHQKLLTTTNSLAPILLCHF